MIFAAFMIGFIVGWIVNEKLEKGIGNLNPWKNRK
jgi:hypothetical protein